MRNVAHVNKLVKKSSADGPAETLVSINSTLPVSTPETTVVPRPMRKTNAPSRYEDYILV